MAAVPPVAAPGNPAGRLPPFGNVKPLDRRSAPVLLGEDAACEGRDDDEGDDEDGGRPVETAAWRWCDFPVVVEAVGEGIGQRVELVRCLGCSWLSPGASSFVSEGFDRPQ